MTTTVLPLAAITVDPELRPRVEIDAETWEAYAFHLSEGGALPPVRVVREGDVFWLADGHHRVAAYRALCFESIEADVVDATRETALQISLGANGTHGKPRDPADLRRAYAAAVRNALVEPDDVDAVALTLRCSKAWAEVLTREAREALTMAKAVAAAELDRSAQSSQIGHVPEAQSVALPALGMPG